MCELLHTWLRGTGISKADRLYAASLVTAEATVRTLLSASPDRVSLVAMGDNGVRRTNEDELCAIHLRNRLEGRPSGADVFVGSFGPVARSSGFLIRLDRSSILRMLRSR